MMIAEERRRQICDWVAEAGSVSAMELEKRLGVSTMTVWRDLNTLEAEGKILRVHGGAVRVDPLQAAVAEPRFCERMEIRKREKNLIARYAVEKFVGQEDILSLDSGTTVTCLVNYLGGYAVTLLTNGLNVATIASKTAPHLTLMCSGGILREKTKTFVGPQAEAFFRDFRAHIFFLSATGLAWPEGITDPNPLEIEVKRSMAAGANRRIDGCWTQAGSGFTP
ncbi:DeoR/GlpR transcriptional regulator [bacterium]|nr:DeoR/GlpR transcriptional regulator [bacterium]